MHDIDDIVIDDVDMSKVPVVRTGLAEQIYQLAAPYA